MNWKNLLIGKWSWKRPIYSLASIYLLLLITVVFFGDRLIFIPPAPSYAADLPSLKFIASSEKETIAFIHLKATPGKPTLIFSHGNAEDMGDWLPVFENLHSMGFGILGYDYPGYGKSTGTATEASCERSIHAVHQHLKGLGIPDSSIIIVGRSVGSGPSVWLASRMNAKALILISAFTSTNNVAFPLPFPIFPRDRFPNLTRIRTINTSLLVIHGEDDEVIPYSHGRKLFAASPASTKEFFEISAAGHNDLFQIGGEEIIAKIAEFSSKEFALDQQ